MPRVCSCGRVLEGPGNPRTCQECKDKQILDGRTKTCSYRNCQKIFVDKGLKNCSKYCSGECGRREAAFRLGKASDLSYFRSEKPKLENLCTDCKERYEGFDKGGRCKKCREEARNKICRKCQKSYRDDTLKNSRRYCDDCI